MPVPQQPVDLDPTVIEFGSEPAVDPPPTPRRSLATAGRTLAHDHRVVPLAALLGAVAAFASLISEWQVTTIDASVIGEGEFGSRMLPSDLVDLGAFGGGYLTGLFLLVGAVVLTLLGPPAGRRYARLAGLSVGGSLLGLLVSLFTLLGDTSRVVSRLYTVEPNAEQFKLGYGRGLWCAVAAVVLAMVALYLAGRRPVGPAAGETGGDVAADDEDYAVWSWRRPRTEDVIPDEPFDLTVGPAQPFTSRVDDQDRPAG